MTFPGGFASPGGRQGVRTFRYIGFSQKIHNFLYFQHTDARDGSLNPRQAGRHFGYRHYGSERSLVKVVIEKTVFQGYAKISIFELIFRIFNAAV